VTPDQDSWIRNREGAIDGLGQCKRVDRNGRADVTQALDKCQATFQQGASTRVDLLVKCLCSLLASTLDTSNLSIVIEMSLRFYDGVMEIQCYSLTTRRYAGRLIFVKKRNTYFPRANMLRAIKKNPTWQTAVTIIKKNASNGMMAKRQLHWQPGVRGCL